MAERQQILHLWLSAAALDTEVKAWAFYDGTDSTDGVGGTEGPDASGSATTAGAHARFGGPARPYETGLQALRDGWMLLQTPGPITVDDLNGDLPNEFVFERRR